MANFIRQFIILVSLLFVVVKLIMTIFRRKEFKALLDGIDADYEEYNSLPEHYHPIINDTVNKTKTLEKVWIFVMCVTASSFPLLAGICTIYSQMFSETPRRFMVHEVAVMFLTEEEISLLGLLPLNSLHFTVHILFGLYLWGLQFAQVANVAYRCSWEKIRDVVIRRSICMIIGKAQNPVHLRALGMVTFNMEMFVSILQTSYSMYTLLRS